MRVGGSSGPEIAEFARRKEGRWRCTRIVFAVCATNTRSPEEEEDNEDGGGTLMIMARQRRRCRRGMRGY